LTCKYCFLLLQAFIDKFRYNAKRASLVQSRIKVLIIINIRSLNQILKTYNSRDLSLNFIGQGVHHSNNFISSLTSFSLCLLNYCLVLWALCHKWIYMPILLLLASSGIGSDGSRGWNCQWPWVCTALLLWLNYIDECRINILHEFDLSLLLAMYV
jgi:hypothetical protein